jgi:gliding motility-associated-like protein
MQTGNQININPAALANAGTYMVFGNHQGCLTDTALHTIQIIPLPSASIISANNFGCEGDSVVIFGIANNSTTFLWNGPGLNNFLSPTLSLDSVSQTQTGIYTVQPFNYFCGGPIDTFHIQIDPYPSLFIGNDTTICENDLLTLTAMGTYNNLVWYDGSNSSSVSIQSAGIYYAIANNNGCYTFDTIQITTVNCNNFKTNIFSPNGDGYNDFFHFDKEGIKDINCQIFDRWGIKMAELTSRDDVWGGKNEKTNMDCPPGTYYYIGEIISIRDSKHSVSGFIQLVR